MDEEKMDIAVTSASPVPFARSYQLEALEMALKQNTIVFLETGSGKTLIAIMLLRNYAYLLRKPSPFIAVFLVPKVVLISQQAQAVKMHTDLKVGTYNGGMGVDFWDAATWEKEIEKHELLVMTPQILLDGLRHRFFKLDFIKVLIFDECHHARGKHAYACIMSEFYHRQLSFGNSELPRIFGMTASPIKAKGGKTSSSYWEKIHELETIMNSKVYTTTSEAVVAHFIPYSAPKFKFYKHIDIPYLIYEPVEEIIRTLKAQHEGELNHLDLNDLTAESARKKLSKIYLNIMYCLNELGVWLAFKAAQFMSLDDTDFLSMGKFGSLSEKIVKDFSAKASLAFENHISTGLNWLDCDDSSAYLDAGLLTTKTVCLIESLLDYRNLKDIRCIVFVERVITAVVVESLLSELLPKYSNWKTKYIAGNSSRLQHQSRKAQDEIVDEFRDGLVNIIVATSILEEGLDVQSCNLVIRFDPSDTICSFIQSRGRARMHNSEYVIMLKSGDICTQSRMEKYLASGDIMRKESLRHAALPCSSFEGEFNDDDFFQVESTGAIVTLSSSISLIYFYCSRLPSDGYFKPAPRCVMEKENKTFTLHLPSSCPIRSIVVEGNIKTLKQKACLEACKQLHALGALTDYLVPDTFVEEAHVKEAGSIPYNDDQPVYFPPDLVYHGPHRLSQKYHSYLIKLNQKFEYEIPVHDIVLMIPSELDSDILSLNFELEAERGSLMVNLIDAGEFTFPLETINLCRMFNIGLFEVLLDHELTKIYKGSSILHAENDPLVDYFLLPMSCYKPSIDWATVTSVLFKYEDAWKNHLNCPLNDNSGALQTKSGLACKCMLRNSLVCTPHNGKLYCITGFFDDLDGRSHLRHQNEGFMTYSEYYEKKYSIILRNDQQLLLKARQIFTVKNYICTSRQKKEKESQKAFVELPPELCSIIMCPISVTTFYTFTFIPSIMYRLESLLIASNLKKCCPEVPAIPTTKVLEAITTKKCQERFHLESLETLGDSFLKYAASQQLFKTFQNHHEGLLSIKKDKIISNASLCKLGCDSKLPGFIRTEAFDPRKWTIPGDNPETSALTEEFLSDMRKIYVQRRRMVKRKRVADVVEALIGAYLSAGGEVAALQFMNWIGIEVDFIDAPYERIHVQPNKFININYLESLLNYSFRDPSLLLEALTHGSYMFPDIPRCYQRLEFLGDSVLDYLMTVHLYNKYPDMSPGMLTDMRSASVNNECFAQSALRAELHKHILHASQDLHRDIANAVKHVKKHSSFGWESETSLAKVLGDVIESLAGAILVDSGYNKEIVFKSIRPLLEPLITPETMKLHPVRELHQLCQKEHFKLSKPIVAPENGMISVTIEVEANGKIFRRTSTAAKKDMAKKLAYREILKSLKENN
ncbi:hypothetical protein K2173_011841 [Erythroxylum novogranatense]|uniref:Uncharacterized protein n=1 Tax=Erythroxylum novogranatense TaxID=1862640 RepID=A0AAV8SLK0_9ROSI|nr:hypothetical protein K2173_011841 [Erythroxylum novogranatense]